MGCPRTDAGALKRRQDLSAQPQGREADTLDPHPDKVAEPARALTALRLIDRLAEEDAAARGRAFLAQHAREERFLRSQRETLCHPIPIAIIFVSSVILSALVTWGWLGSWLVGVACAAGIPLSARATHITFLARAQAAGSPSANTDRPFNWIERRLDLPAQPWMEYTALFFGCSLVLTAMTKGWDLSWLGGALGVSARFVAAHRHGARHPTKDATQIAAAPRADA